MLLTPTNSGPLADLPGNNQMTSGTLCPAPQTLTQMGFLLWNLRHLAILTCQLKMEDKVKTVTCAEEAWVGHNLF